MNLLKVWDSHGTKVLGTLSTVISAVIAAAVIVEDVIPDSHMKYWLFASALLGGATVKRGFTNSQKLNAWADIS